MFFGVCTFIVHMDQEPYQVWRNHRHKILFTKGILDFWVLQEYLTTTQHGGMVGIITLGFEWTAMDGFMDVSTPTAFSMWESILDTPFRTIESD